jgi:hypothetical protein
MPPDLAAPAIVMLWAFAAALAAVGVIAVLDGGHDA